MWTWKSVPERPCGYGDAHTDNTLCRGIEVKQDCGYSLGQINLRNYPERFALCGLPIVKVGIILIVSGIRWGIGLSNKELECFGALRIWHQIKNTLVTNPH